MKPLVFCILCLSCASAQAGDAVVIGYNADGVWTAVTYYCSSSPKGGRDYKNAAQAREEAMRDLRKRAGNELVRSSVVAESDSTGYFAVARGKTALGKDETVVGFGKSQSDADKKALADLNRAGATTKQKIFYRYFSHGDDATPKS